MRRRFFEFHAAAELLARVHELYAIEAAIRGHPAEHRRQVRLKRSLPVVEALHAWPQFQQGRVSTASGLGKASATRCGTGPA